MSLPQQEAVRRERHGLLPDTLERFTATTITDRTALDRELTLAVRDGFAIGYGEHDDGPAEVRPWTKLPERGRL